MTTTPTSSSPASGDLRLFNEHLINTLEALEIPYDIGGSVAAKVAQPLEAVRPVSGRSRGSLRYRAKSQGGYSRF